MANTSADEVAELKQELAQFLLTEITSAQGAQTFRKEVGAEVAAVIDQLLNERLTPAIQRIESQAAEQANALTARVDAALRRFEQGAPVAAGPSPETDQKIAELTARLDEMRARLLRTEEQGRRAVAQPIAAPKLADERIAVTPKNTSLVPRWALWVIILLLTLTALAIGNIYIERMTAAEPAPVTNNPQPGHDLDPLGTTLWKSRQAQAMVADADNEIPRNRRRRALGNVIIEPFELSFRSRVEDNPVLHPLLGFRLLRAMTRFKPGKDRFGRNPLRRIPLELGQASRNFLAQPPLPLRLEILKHAQAGADNLTGIVVAA